MATAILFKNADLYAPEHKGIKQILTVNDKIIAVEDEISADLPGLEVIDLNGAIVTPGLIDQHIHVTGGGGEGGPLTRAPELNFSELVEGGITSFVGVSGTDSETRPIEALMAKGSRLNQRRRYRLDVDFQLSLSSDNCYRRRP